MIIHRTRLRIIQSGRLSHQNRKIFVKPQWRRSLTSTSTSKAVSPDSAAPSSLASITSQLDQSVPRIDIRADQIEVVQGPNEFYETLKNNIRAAKTRIYLSTLYIGKTEHELISTIQEALQRAPQLRVSILTDALRGTREDPEPSCASLLASLLAKFPDRVEIRMYHTPNLTGLRKRYIPKRINEGWGLQHIKLYGIDDKVILSGANLSSDYFTNRQDRYHVFSSKRVTDYFARIHHAVCSISFLLHGNGSSHTLTWPPSNPAPSPFADAKGYITAATSLLLPLSSPSASPPPSSNNAETASATKTTLYPLLCHPPTINTELPSLRTLLTSSNLQSYTFTAGYFNPHPLITSTLLSLSSRLKNPAQGTILTASPYANGFYNSAGVSGLLPAAYTHLSLRFLQAARRKSANISLREWRRGTVGENEGWTYHAKGVWATFPPSRPPPSTDGTPQIKEAVGPSATIIGSSNYTARSYGLDLEVGALVVTDDEGLMRKWKAEEDGLRAWTREVKEEELGGEERRAGWRVRVAMWIVKVVGGAL
ncbi:MAG: hypothetical protein Q9219_002342 [cf. Caloplaca sp. 3 TL-2023]